MERRVFRFSIQDIARASGKTVWGVRKDRQRGKVDPEDLASLAVYVEQCRRTASGPALCPKAE